jgi:hypothetical protein
MTKSTLLCVENWSGVMIADGMISTPTIASAFAGLMR